MLALVTGATGFVGANLVETLTAAGWQVRALHRPTSSLAALKGLDYEPVIGDVTDPDSLVAAMAGCEAVFHVAGITADYWDQNLAMLYRVNVEGTANVVEAALAAGVPHLVHTSSLTAMGFSTDGTPLTEDHRFNFEPAEYPYGHSKWLAEGEVRKGVARGLHAVIVNPTVVFGARDVTLLNSRIIFEVKRGLIQFVPPGGNNVVAAADVARGHLLALERGRPGERYILAGHNGTVLELVRAVAAVLGVRPPRGTIPRAAIGPLAALLDIANRLSPRPLPLSGPILRLMSADFYADNGKARRELGFTVTPLPETIERAVAWLRAEGHLPPSPAA